MRYPPLDPCLTPLFFLNRSALREILFPPRSVLIGAFCCPISSPTNINRCLASSPSFHKTFPRSPFVLRHSTFLFLPTLTCSPLPPRFVPGFFHSIFFRTTFLPGSCPFPVKFSVVFPPIKFDLRQRDLSLRITSPLDKFLSDDFSES